MSEKKSVGEKKSKRCPAGPRTTAMMGRPRKLNWTPSLNNYTVTIEGKLHRLGTDKDEAEKQYRFLLAKHDMAEPVTNSSPTFGEVAEAWLLHIETIHDAERF